MKTTWKPLNLIPMLVLIGMAIAGLIDWWVFVAITISTITLQ